MGVHGHQAQWLLCCHPGLGLVMGVHGHQIQWILCSSPVLALVTGVCGHRVQQMLCSPPVLVLVMGVCRGGGQWMLCSPPVSGHMEDTEAVAQNVAGVAFILSASWKAGGAHGWWAEKSRRAQARSGQTLGRTGGLWMTLHGGSRCWARRAGAALAGCGRLGCGGGRGLGRRRPGSRREGWAGPRGRAMYKQKEHFCAVPSRPRTAVGTVGTHLPGGRRAGAPPRRPPAPSGHTRYLAASPGSSTALSTAGRSASAVV